MLSARRLLSVSVVLAAAGGVVVAPVVTRPGPHPVRPTVSTLAVQPVARPLPVAATTSRSAPASTAGVHRTQSTRSRSSLVRAVLATVSRPHTRHFELVGARWSAGTIAPGAAQLEVRVHAAHGWTAWTSLAADDGGADAGTPDARRAAALHAGQVSAAPVWVGSADGVQARVIGPPSARSAANVRVVLVDGGASGADARAGAAAAAASADAATGQPTILTRRDWGADESLRTSACSSGPDYGSTIKMGFVHHTDNGNGYTRSQVPAIIRSIYAYHVRSNGWCDIGYNYLVDRFGRIWEGRYGGITRPVVGAHTGGFNTDTFGVALIGNFSSTAPTSAMRAAVERLFAWRLGRYYRDPLGRTHMVAGSFSGSRYAAGSDVRFRVVSGHRDADYTTCPGADAYAALPGIRSGVVADLGAGFVGPAASASSVRMAGGSVRVHAGAVGPMTWRLTIRDSAGTTVATVAGSADRGTPVQATWGLTDADGVPVLPGTYSLVLTGTSAGGAAALPWRHTVQVTPPVTVTVPAQVALGASVRPHGTGVPGHHVTVTSSGGDTLTTTVDDAGRWRVGAVAADADLRWTVVDGDVPGYGGAHGRTRVGPALTAPALPLYVPAGTDVALQGTALPGVGSPVTVAVTTATGATSVQAPVSATGGWTADIVPVGATAVVVTDARGLASAPARLFGVRPPVAGAPAEGWADRSVVVGGNADAPVRVTVAVTGPDGWQWSATSTAGPDGAFRTRMPLPAVGADTVLGWTVTSSSPDGSQSFGSRSGTLTVHPAFAPTATAPSHVRWDSTAPVTGRAVPGDTLRLQVAATGSSSWSTAASTHAAADGTFALAMLVTRDTQWRLVDTHAGTACGAGSCVTGTVVVRPTIAGPAQVAPGAAARLHGVAVPGASLVVQRRLTGGHGWTTVATVTVAADGSWQDRRHPRHTTDFRAVSLGHASRVVTVTVAS